jgi:hypothetical protein
MKHRQIKIDNRREIDIFDNVHEFKDSSAIYDYAKRSSYSLNRTASDSVMQSQQFTTLLSEYNIYDLLHINFFKPKFIQDLIIKNQYRLHRAYVNLSTSQDIYHYHVDSTEVNDKTMLYYCNTYWEETWEGETHFSDDNAKEIIASASLKPNRLVLFNGTIPHKSSQPSFFAREYRFVLTLKFSSPERLDYQTDFPISDFFINDSEYNNSAVSFIKQLAIDIPHSKTTLFNHLYNTYKILKSHGADETTCLAGLYHSVYGTEFYNRLNLDREEVQAVIGKEAENLVYKFCSLTDRDSQLLGSTNVDPRLVHIAYANLIEEKFRDQSHESEIIAYKNHLEKVKRK